MISAYDVFFFFETIEFVRILQLYLLTKFMSYLIYINVMLFLWSNQNIIQTALRAPSISTPEHKRLLMNVIYAHYHALSNRQQLSKWHWFIDRCILTILFDLIPFNGRRLCMVQRAQSATYFRAWGLSHFSYRLFFVLVGGINEHIIIALQCAQFCWVIKHGRWRASNIKCFDYYY